ncbi:hypothetical protein F2Q69_00017426 [Brassica cretica]|uniref:Uncharacterized protein n=1 Tax=Brassica cretica TaxID=69181 RepID=A0A8S9R0C6_BRACR|nr:hypothetical protein F2Q69_00017426 [Brassica cretica]
MKTTFYSLVVSYEVSATYWNILWNNWRCLEALWSKRRWKLKLVRVQATTTRVEGTRDNSPARTEMERRYWSILWSNLRCLEALWSKRRWKLKLVRVQATTTRVEGTRDNSPARTELERRYDAG